MTDLHEILARVEKRAAAYCHEDSPFVLECLAALLKAIISQKETEQADVG